MIVALAGRRIDAPGVSTPVFPIGNVQRVRHDIRQLFSEQGVRALVCSAACGADLLALDVAGGMGIDRRIILPFEPAQFRATSVVDRPGDWGLIFDRVIAEAQSHGNIVDLHLPPGDDESYLKTNNAILDEAVSLSAQLEDSAAAVLVWNKQPRTENDITDDFGNTARAKGLVVFEIATV